MSDPVTAVCTDLFENMFEPPDLARPYAPFWAAFLFRQLVGEAVILPTTVDPATAPPGFHAYAFTHVAAAPIGGSALLLLNLDRTLVRGPNLQFGTPAAATR